MSASRRGGRTEPAVPRVTVAACDACLRRTDLIAAVAGSIDIAWRERKGRTSRVLARPDAELLRLDPSAAARYERFDPAFARRRIEAAGLSAVCRCEAAYPDRLRELPDPPAVLHVAGSLAAVPTGEAAAIVGARRATPYGLDVSRTLGRALTAAGLPVVSGMALGIDSAAHVGALEAWPAATAEPPSTVGALEACPAATAGPPSTVGALEAWPAATAGPPSTVGALEACPAATAGPPSTVGALEACPAATAGSPSTVGALEAPLNRAAPPVAVLAGGAETAYPARMRGLHARLIAAGAVVSEMPPGFTCHRWCFPARNRIIAALATVTIVVEAATKSGSLITADLATDLGRVVAAVPGPVTSRYSAGANELLHAGAAVIRGPRDVLDLVLGPDAPEPEATGPPVPALDRAQRRLLDAIERGRGTLAELAGTMEEARAASRTLSELELLGLVRRGFGGRYVRCA